MNININIKFNFFKPRKEKIKIYEPSAPPYYEQDFVDIILISHKYSYSYSNIKYIYSYDCKNLYFINDKDMVCWWETL